MGDGIMTDYATKRETHDQAFIKLAEYVKENVVDNYRAEFMMSIHTRYKSILDDLGVKCTRYSVQALTEKIANHLGACIVVTRGSEKQETYCTILT